MDIDECSAANGGCDHVCSNTMGSFQCSCVTGFNLNVDSSTCDDVDECNVGNDVCQQNCNNIIGSYWCSCGTGYRLNSDSRTCADVDECSGANGGCAQACANTISNVDECASGNGGCEQHCTNNIGSFDCSCSTGYRLNSDALACDDVNECDTANGGCDQTCTNSIGSFQCSCGIGYTLNGDGFSCDDVDECHTANGGCEQMCSNTIGSFQCVCDNGYVLNGDGFACNDIDECDTANGGCGQICNNTIGSFECLCHPGYILNIDGFACDDIDECETANGGCGQFCTNTIGGFNCSCATGYNISTDQFACNGFDPMSRLTCLSTTTTSISVSWKKPVAHIMGYSVMYIPVSGFSQSSVMTTFLSRNDTNATISGLFSGVQYSLTVLSFGLWNDSANADVECTTDMPPPMNFTFSHVTENSANFHWQKPVRAQVVAYRVWLIDKETALTVSTQYLLDSATSTAFTYLTPAAEYVVAITCISLSVEGPQASVAIITDTDPPRQLLVDDIRYSNLALSWIPPVAKLSEYQLTYSSAEQRRERRALSSFTLPGDISNYWLYGLVPATQYTISLTAVSRFGNSGTIDLMATTGTDPPTELKVETVSSSWLHVVWTPPVAAVISYDLTVTDATSQEKIHISISPAEMELNITELFPITKYIIRIEAVSMYGRSAEVMCFGTTADYIDAVKDTATSFPASTKLLRTTETVLTTTASPELKINTNTFWLEDFTTPPKRKDTTAKPRTFVMDQFEITSTAATTDPQLTTDVPKAPTTPSGMYKVNKKAPSNRYRNTVRFRRNIDIKFI
ncbi:tenascin-like [Branchiostoma floridae]|uniref:Tenascin-like n=1 Tax=Branchiostoma floridae TaxID=7739 RepID=A0A9J7HMU7_BRAFL|nr:tenascin-like [Branchiostoma floridae]